MTKMARTVAIGLVAVAAAAPAHAATPRSSNETIVVRVADLSTLRAIDVEKARAVAAAFYEEIGVSLVWLGTSDATPEMWRGALELRVAFLSGERTARLLEKQKISPAALGVAPHDVAIVYLFCHRIEIMARDAGTLITTILGRVLAHEIGHQLLPWRDHSTAGIMRAQVDVAPVTRGFDQSQRESIRSLLATAR